MRYVSIPVHENIGSILSQIKNLNRYMPNAKLVLHLSKNAMFSIKTLEAAISKELLQNCYVNPVQVETAWGSILAAHISNIKFIKSFSNASQIVFHSSNDMLVKCGVEDYLDCNLNIFNLRQVMYGSRWWPGQVALQDETFMNLVASYGSGALFGSQIEGCAYDAELLYEIVMEMERADISKARLFYPREELVFSTLANALGIKPTGLPYVYSEVHVFDRYLWNILDRYKFILELDNRLSSLLKKMVNNFIYKMNFYKIKISDVKNIAEGTSDFKEILNDGNSKWRIFENKNLYAVKRVERDVSNKVRVYIEGMM
jgi:hypothetical protein